MEPRVTVSAALRSAVWAKRAEGIKHSELARAAGLHPSTFSSLINDLVPLRAGDERVLRIAAVVGVRPLEAFTVIREKGGRRVSS